MGLWTIRKALASFADDDDGKADLGLERRLVWWLSNVPKSCSIICVGVRDERFFSIKNDTGDGHSFVFIWLLLLLLFILADGKIWRKCERFFFSEDFIDDDDDDNVAEPLLLLYTVWKWPDVEDDDDEVTAEGTRIKPMISVAWIEKKLFYSHFMFVYFHYPTSLTFSTITIFFFVSHAQRWTLHCMYEQLAAIHVRISVKGDCVHSCCCCR